MCDKTIEALSDRDKASRRYGPSYSDGSFFVLETVACTEGDGSEVEAVDAFVVVVGEDDVCHGTVVERELDGHSVEFVLDASLSDGRECEVCVVAG